MADMTAADVIDLYTELQNLGINVWIDGGWGVDALLGAQTRPHKDLDMAIEEKDVSGLTAALEARGYREVIRHSQWNFELSDERGRQVDVHSFVLSPDGNVEKGIMYPPGSLTGTGTIGGHAVRCVSADWMVKFHSGYELQEKDFRDVCALCEKFGIELPQEYVQFKSAR
jgi:lincosamide nucleotidyltransferase A/C/D/E